MYRLSYKLFLKGYLYMYIWWHIYKVVEIFVAIRGWGIYKALSIRLKDWKKCQFRVEGWKEFSYWEGGWLLLKKLRDYPLVMMSLITKPQGNILVLMIPRILLRNLLWWVKYILLSIYIIISIAYLSLHCVFILCFHGLWFSSLCQLGTGILCWLCWRWTKKLSWCVSL